MTLQAEMTSHQALFPQERLQDPLLVLWFSLQDVLLIEVEPTCWLRLSFEDSSLLLLFGKSTCLMYRIDSEGKLQKSRGVGTHLSARVETYQNLDCSCAVWLALLCLISGSSLLYRASMAQSPKSFEPSCPKDNVALQELWLVFVVHGRSSTGASLGGSKGGSGPASAHRIANQFHWKYYQFLQNWKHYWWAADTQPSACLTKQMEGAKLRVNVSSLRPSVSIVGVPYWCVDVTLAVMFLMWCTRSEVDGT